MKSTVYLVATISAGRYNSGTASYRVVKDEPKKLKPNELAFKLAITIPDEMFKRYIPTVAIDVPRDMLVNPDSEVAINFTAEAVSDSLRLDIEKVEDGLRQMLQDKLDAYTEEKLLKGLDKETSDEAEPTDTL